MCLVFVVLQPLFEVLDAISCLVDVNSFAVILFFISGVNIVISNIVISKEKWKMVDSKKSTAVELFL